MKKKDEIRKELESLSPGLGKEFERPDAFRVPANYFSELPGNLIGKIRTADQPMAGSAQERAAWWEPLLSALFAPRYRLALASMILLIAAGILYSRYSRGEDSRAISFVSISSAEAYAYLEADLAAVEESLIVETAAEMAEADLFLENTLEKEEIGRYLDQNLEDVELEMLEESIF